MSAAAIDRGPQKFPPLQIQTEYVPILAILVIPGDATDFAKAVLYVERAGALVRHFHHETDAANAATFQPAKGGREQRVGCAFAANCGIYRDGFQSGATYQQAPGYTSDGVPDHPVAALDHQEQFPASFGIFCKQVAIPGPLAESGALNRKDAVEIRWTGAAHRKLLAHFCYPLFSRTWGRFRNLWRGASISLNVRLLTNIP